MERTSALLIAAHFIGDFLLQPGALVHKKRRFGYLFLHSVIHGALVYVALWSWSAWHAPAAVLVLHLIIDGFKQREKDTAFVFALDQAAHVLGLLAIAWMLSLRSFQSNCPNAVYLPFIVLGGFAAAVTGSGFFIGKYVKDIVPAPLDQDGLPNGGALIGRLERSLIFLLIFIGQAAGIGFLVAAKSILRFRETQERKLAEYVLIGTLLSFSLAIALASATKWAATLPVNHIGTAHTNPTAATTAGTK